MNLAATQLVPLTLGEGGSVRVRGTRVSLDSVVYAFKEGVTAEDIVDRFPSLELADV